MLTIPVVVMIVGLIVAFLHLGSPGHVFNMLSGLGTSPLPSEIVVQAINCTSAVAKAAFAFVVVLVGAFLARVRFYGLFLNIGL